VKIEPWSIRGEGSSNPWGLVISQGSFNVAKLNLNLQDMFQSQMTFKI
jgi:hypothetical protein